MDAHLERIFKAVGLPDHHHLHLKQIFKFGLNGVANLALYTALLTYSQEILEAPLLPSLIVINAFILAIVFLVNKYWSFRNNEKKHGIQAVKFAIVYGTSYILNVSGTWALTNVVGIFYLWSSYIMIAIGAIWNYCGLHFIVFKKR